MLQKILFGLGIIVVLIVSVGAAGDYFDKPEENIVLDFIKDHPERAAIKVVFKSRTIAENNSTKVMPLASTVKIIMAIEYAEQAASGSINPDQKIPLTELNKFYIPNTDGNAHPRWLKSVKDKIKEDRISVREIAKGMIAYSSNANTEWLSEKLGLENINNRLDSLGIKDHTAIYYIVSALFVGKEKFPNLDGNDLEEQVRGLSINEYIKVVNQVHEKLLSDHTYKKELGDMGMKMQRVWSDLLPGSTVEEYVGLMTKINSRNYFGSETHKYLNEVMESLMRNPENKKLFRHAGMKGGSTAFVLTKALYATDVKGNKIEASYFLNELNIFENQRLQRSMNQFELKLLTDETFRKTVEEAFTN